jgi:death-on-curing protein
MDVKTLSIEEVIELHSMLIEKWGGLDGVRDMNALDGSIHSHLHTFEGIFLYPTIEAMAAHLGFSLVNTHVFLDGNKRIGILTMITFLELNGITIESSDQELTALGLGLAEKTFDEQYVIEWIESHKV